MSYDLVREEFPSLHNLIKTIESRPNSKFMRHENSSHEGSKSFTGTNSYEEALELLQYGYRDPIPKIKEKLRESKRVSNKIYASIPHPIPRNQVVGFIPNVPNALRGVPESMISIDKVIQKKKTLNIIYSFGSCCRTNSEDLLKAGVALVSAINIIETSGIQTKLDLGFMPTSESGDEIIFPTVRIKDFGERFSLQKVSFPMIHPSMFRRIGFKYLETCSICKEDYSCGYGHVPGMDTLKELFDGPSTKVISSDWIIRNKFDIEKILKEMDVDV